MTTAHQVPIVIDNDYEIAAALHRAKVIANYKLHPDEILPVNGCLRVSLSSTALSRDEQTRIFGLSRIDIPEFREERKKLK